MTATRNDRPLPLFDKQDQLDGLAPQTGCCNIQPAKRQSEATGAPAELLPMAAKKLRLSRQCREILARLRVGPATNQELASIALKYTSRISDLRKAGYDVRCVREDKASGKAWYEVRGGLT